MEILAVTIDNSRQLRKVPGMVSSKGWEYTVLSDENGNFQQTMGVATIPQTHLINEVALEMSFEPNKLNPNQIKKNHLKFLWLKNNLIF